MADIKRANNLIQEQDFYALKSVRIPIQKHSFLEETSTNHQEELLRSSAKPRPVDTSRTHRQQKEVSDFVMDLEEDTERLIQNLNDPGEKMLGKQSRFTDREGPLGKPDCGVQWWNALVAMLLIGIILPVFFVLVFKMKSNNVMSSADSVIQHSSSFSNASAFSTVAAAGRD